MSGQVLTKDVSGRGSIPLEASDALITERFRVLFTKIDQVSRQERKKVIAVTSAVEGEGKTMTSVNLAVVAARDFGKRTLIVDGDFRNPSISRCFGMTEAPGLLNILAKDCDFKRVVKQGPVKDLAILTMGYLSDKFSFKGDVRKGRSVWASNTMKVLLNGARKWFDYIWIDAPPVLPTFDMDVISAEVDGILFVVKAGETPETVLSQAIKSLGREKVIGSVLNQAKAA